jgi:hypothetical protein
MTEARRVRMAHAAYGALFLALAVSFILAFRQADASGSLSLLMTSM